ncbi:MAG: ABC transporter substrate-binding protein [Gemmatimonadales bacterium]
MTDKLIVSLLPGATEMVAAIGGVSQLVGVSHACDWPPAIESLPRVTLTPIDASRSSLEIHGAVQAAAGAGQSVIGIDADVLRTLRPDVIITQMLCDVCAVADGEAIALARAMTPAPEIVTLSGTTIDGVWHDIRKVGSAIGRSTEAMALTSCLEAEVAAIAARSRKARSRVVAIEWLEPLFLAGHWVPEMVTAAGGRDVGGVAGSHSVIRSWDEVIGLDPDLVLLVLCGFSEERARMEMERQSDARARDWLASRRVAILDGNAYTSRPGPRIIEGIRQIEAALAGAN